ncbi:MAG: DUF3990 domain-containing protein [Fibrobacter sp.]|nr:DUF3990 domain-containing protein [Fibrobacter sp.]
MGQIVYHGSCAEVKNPSVILRKRTKDFGPGFYCTLIKEQAHRWAMKFETPLINFFEYRIPEKLKILEFKTMTEEWLDFIVACRNGVGHDYDIVIGAMADDQIYNFISDFIEGNLTREQFWILAKFKYPAHQICFCTENALQSIKFLKSEVACGT